MTIYTDRIVLVFPIAAKNRQAAASLQTLEVTESGKEIETLVPLDPALVGDYADQFGLGLIADNASQLEQIASLQTQLAEALALVEEYRPFDPNQIRSDAFYARISKDELFALAVLASTDTNAKGILDLLSAYKANDWQVLLDDTQVVGAMTYLTGLGVLTSDRAGQIVAAATRAEAYL